MSMVVVVVPAPVDKTPHVKRALCSRANPSAGRTRHPYDTLYRVDKRARARTHTHPYYDFYCAHIISCITAADCECDFRNGNNRHRPMVSQNIYFHIIPITIIYFSCIQRGNITSHVYSCVES